MEGLEKKRLEIATEVEEVQKKMKDPAYVQQSSELAKLTADLDEYVVAIRTAFSEDSDQFRQALEYRTNLLGDQRRLDATTLQATLTEEMTTLREGMMFKDQLRILTMNKNLARVNAWVASAREAGMEEVEIVRRAEEMKTQIRAAAQKQNPMKDQMKQWSEYGSNMQQAATGWADGAVSGMTDVFMGRGSDALKGALDQVMNDIVSNQMKFMFSDMFGDKATDASSSKFSAGSEGASSKFAGKGAAPVPIAHTGAIVGGTMARKRASPSAFLNAPRFHTGGIVGEEVPVIALKREGIFTEEQMKSLAPVGSGGGNITINAPVSVQASGGSPEQNNDLARKISREMEGNMRGVVVDEMRRQMRPGNMMNR
jgi:hypothetical protein